MRSESKKARKGIKTVTGLAQGTTAILSESKKARKGIKTYFCSCCNSCTSCMSESKKARKGIKTIMEKPTNQYQQYYSQNQKKPVRALRLKPTIKITVNNAAKSESKKARKGIKTLNRI